MLVTSGIGQASPSTQSSGAAIKLKAATFTPTRGEAPAIPPGLAIGGYTEGQRGYYLVQFAGPVEQQWKDQVAAAGAEILEYVPEFAFKVRMNPAEARRVAQIGDVVWVDVFNPAYKLSPDLKRDGTNLYRVSVERGVDKGQVQAAIARIGGQAVLHGDTLVVAADSALVDAIVQVLDVAWIDNYVLWEKHNDFGGGNIIGASVANRTYNGNTQTVAVADTGIGGGTTATAHRDIPSSRVTTVQNFPGVTDACFQTIYNDGAVDVDSGHGTHVAGSVLSGGDPGGFGRGVAPEAKLVFQATENYVAVSSFCRNFYGYTNGYYLTGLNDLYGLFNQAYAAGARIHANSWGSSQAGDYTATSATTDQFIWDKKNMTITFSAGNSGADADANGVVDNDSIGAPATAKNVITIGASENDRKNNYQCDTGLTYTSHDSTYQSGQTCGSMGGNNTLGTPRQRWGFTANPIADDPSAGNQEQMAAFSSRGPTDDGRIKPDVVAPGTWILSTYSSQHQEGYGDPTNPRTGAYQSDGWGMPRNEYYKYFGGTSMSNPIAAVAATVVRDYFQKAHTHDASAALVKATLINSAVDLQDEKNDGTTTVNLPIPNNHEGWGRVDLANATDGSHKFVDQTTGLGTAGAKSYDATASGGALKVSLVWSDAPSTEAATKNLVNDLDLVVTSQSGAVYRGNVFGDGWSQPNGTADRANNVENVYIASDATETWKVEVKGYNVPNGPQPFALVVDGVSSLAEVASPPPPPATGPNAPSGLTASAISRSQINLAWSDNSGDETGFKIERCQGSTCTNFVQIATVGANTKAYSNTGLARNTTYRYQVRAYNTAGDSAYSNIASATTRNK